MHTSSSNLWEWEKEVISQSLPLNANSFSTISVQSQHPGMTHNKWYNPRRNKHDIIIAGIIASTRLFSFIIYLLLPSEMCEQREGGGEGRLKMHTLFALFLWVIGKVLEGSNVACVCFSWGKYGEGVGKSKREKRVKRLEGKPPAEERKALGPEKMKERGFDNFLQSPSKKVKVSRKTHTTTHSISRSKHPVSEEFLRRHSEVHLIFFYIYTPLHTSLQLNKIFLLFSKQLPDRKPGHEMKIN